MIAEAGCEHLAQEKGELPLVMLLEGLVFPKERKGFQRGFKPQTCFLGTNSRALQTMRQAGSLGQSGSHCPHPSSQALSNLLLAPLP